MSKFGGLNTNSASTGKSVRVRFQMKLDTLYSRQYIPQNSQKMRKKEILYSIPQNSQEMERERERKKIRGKKEEDSIKYTSLLQYLRR